MASHGPLGIHLSVGQKYDDAVAEAKALGISCCQIFTHNPRGWGFAPIDEKAVKKFRDDLRKIGVDPVASHCNYLINLGTNDPEIRGKSIACLKKEFEYAAAFGCQYFVLHVGKYKEQTMDEGIGNVAAGINSAKKDMMNSKVILLLETVAGQGTEIGKDFSDLGKIFPLLDKEIQDKVGVCVDTCHIFEAGYDIRTPEKAAAVVERMDKAFGIGRVKFIHLNDAQKEFDSRVDRHQHIGRGFIGLAGFRAFLNHPAIKPLPKILETPVDEERGYPENLAAVKKLQV